jgi:predicted DNA-binding transcriptional regulator AlpA
MVIFAPIFIVPSDERPDDIVDWSYIAKRTGLARATILGGDGGVSEIPRARRKPAGWFRADVDAWLAKQVEALRKPKTTRPRLIRRRHVA